MSLELAPKPELLLDNFDAAGLNREFAGHSPHEIIERFVEITVGRIAVATSFGKTSAVLLHHVAEVAPETPIINVVHGYETEETNRNKAELTRRLGLDVHEYHAPLLPIPEFGTPEFDEFQHKVKVEPFQRALDDINPIGYFSGQMYWQNGRRFSLPYVERKGAFIAINPVLDTSQEEAIQLVRDHDYPLVSNHYDPAKGPNQKTECQLNTSVYK